MWARGNVLMRALALCSALLAGRAYGDDLFKTVEVSTMDFQVAGMNTSRPVIEIGTALTLTCCSKYHRLGKVLRRGYEIYVNWVNTERGGVDLGGVKHNLKLVMVDDHSDVDRVSAITEYLTDKRGIRLLLSPYSSTLTEPAAVMAHDYGAVLVASASSNTGVFARRPTIFGFQTPTIKNWDSSFRALEGKVKSVAYIAEAGSFPQEACGGPRIGNQALDGNEAGHYCSRRC
jgi:ABC-type branched-subunit amino acid transport system substrate-binding protein